MSKNIKFKENLFEILTINIRKRRLEMKMTQQELAEKIGISHEYYRRFESKKGQEGLSFVTIYKISVVLNISIDDLLKE